MKRGINGAEESQGDPKGYGAPAEAGTSQQARKEDVELAAGSNSTLKA